MMFQGQRVLAKELQILDNTEVIVPHFKKHLSGVTTTIVHLLPIQSQSIGVVATGFGLPTHLPYVSFWSVIFMSRRKPRIWHARRHTEILVGLILRYVFQKKLKIVFHSATQRQRTWYSRWLISTVEIVVTPSRQAALACPRKSQLIPHGGNTQIFHPPKDSSAIKRSLGLPEKMMIGCYGRIRPTKGTDIFVDSMIATLPKYPYLIALVMGRTTVKYKKFLKDLQQRVKQAQLTERILFLPEASVDDMFRWYQVLNLYVTPSCTEGFGLTALEAMACGVPVIATPVGALPDLIVENKTGTLIPSRDVKELNSAIEATLTVPDTLQKWSINARRHVTCHFRIEDEAAHLNTLYRQVLSQ